MKNIAKTLAALAVLVAAASGALAQSFEVLQSGSLLSESTLTVALVKPAYGPGVPGKAVIIQPGRGHGRFGPWTVKVFKSKTFFSPGMAFQAMQRKKNALLMQGALVQEAKVLKTYGGWMFKIKYKTRR